MIQQIAKELIAHAVQQRASDIYLIPQGKTYKIALRIGDERVWLEEHDEGTYTALLSHFKFLAGMNVGEKRRSQLGACRYDYGAGQINLRLSSVGDFQHRESMVIRLLYAELDELHFWFDEVGDLAEVVQQRGLYLFAGPVGSGKTSLMYRLAKEKFPDKQILTIEDPVEIEQADMLQLQLNESIGLTYDHLIKLSLRHRPDLLIIGEIRDQETAQSVLRASLTGVTVFSTVHAKGISGAYDRMLELEVSACELNRSLQAVFYQRLIAGGGVVDVANTDFQNHRPDRWNAQMDRLVEMDVLTKATAAREKIIVRTAG